MRKIFFISLVLLFSITELFSQEIQVDTSRYLKIGIIPYQFLARSSGIYINYAFRTLELEYRLSHTFETDFNGGGDGFGYTDNYFFSGTNNSLVFFFNPVERKRHPRSKFGLILLQKYWQYFDKSVRVSNEWDDPRNEKRSTIMFGCGMGAEFLCDLGFQGVDLGLFVNATLTDFIVQSQVFEGDAYPHNYPRHETYNRRYLNLTLGLKIGYRRKL